MSLIRNIIENERPDIHGTGRLSTVASNVLLSGNLALEDYAVTKNFATVLYTGNGDTQDITTGISSVDFTVSGNGSGYWLDRDTFEVKTDAGDVVTNGECLVNTSKVHIKSRSEAHNNVVYDSLRGAAKEIYTNDTTAETGNTDSVTSFSTTQVSIGADALVNEDGTTYVLYQTLYTHLKWGTTNQDKKYVEAFNPVTRETMVMYEGSGNDEHEIPHSLGVELDYMEEKILSTNGNWVSRGQSWQQLYLNTDTANNTANIPEDGWGISSTSITAYCNAQDSSYILYGKAKSENWTIVQYTGTGAAGNFIETKDVYGVARKPRRVILKVTSTSGDWIVYDSKRLTSSENIELNTDNAELVNSGYNITLDTYGITINGTTGAINASGEQYIALVEFDTNSNGGDGYFNMPTDDSNLNLTDGVFSYTDGKDSNGYVRSTESLAGTTTIDFAGVNDGKHWVARAKDGDYGFYKGLSNGLYNKEYADDNRLVFNPDDGKVYSTTGGELVTNGTFDVDTSGWTAVNDANLSIDNGRLAVNANDTDYPYAVQNFPVEVGVSYKVKCNMSGASPKLRVYTSNFLGELASGGELEVTATNTNFIIRCYMYGTGDDDTAYFDAISVYKLEATLDQPISPISFLPNPIMVTSETPQYIDYTEELAANVMDSLEVSNTIKCNNYLGKNACTAWVNFDGTTTPPTIRDSFNVSDVVRIATGLYELYFNENMNNENYSVNGSANYMGVNHPRVIMGINNNLDHIYFASTRMYDDTEEFSNNPEISIQVFGGKE